VAIEITEDTTIEELLEAFPAANGYLIEHGLPCVVCGEPFWGTVGELARRSRVENVAELIAGLRRHLEGGGAEGEA